MFRKKTIATWHLSSTYFINFDMPIFNKDLDRIEKIFKEEHSKYLSNIASNMKQRMSDLGYNIKQITLNFGGSDIK